MTDFTNTSILIGVAQHFIISLLAGGAIFFAYRKQPMRVFYAAALVMFIDIDHLEIFRNTFGGIRIFHNLLFAMVLPALIMMGCFVRQRKRNEYSGAYTSSLFLVMMTGHIFFDGMDSTPVLLYYPLSDRSLMFNDMFASIGMTGSLNLTVVSILYFFSMILVFYQVNRILKEREEDIQSYLIDDLNNDSLWPVSETRVKLTNVIYEINQLPKRRNIQLCNSISRPRMATMF